MFALFQQPVTDVEALVSEEKTLSIYKLILEGGIGGQIIIALLLVLLTVSLYIYFERFFCHQSS